jgi:hypothetical protein
MPAIDYSSHINATAPSTLGASAAAPQADTQDTTFGDLLDIINPLQHLPIISTLYRAITGDKIGMPEKIIGDTLYGGPLGFVSSVADSVFQSLTGKNVGDTVLAFLTGDDKSDTSNVAAAPASVTPASAISLPTPDLSALLKSLASKGVNQETATRAAFAYGRAIGLSTAETLQ